MEKKKRHEEDIKEEKIIQPRGFFGGKCILDPEELGAAVSHCKGLGMKVVLTMGSWDMVHIGHARYLWKRKNTAIFWWLAWIMMKRLEPEKDQIVRLFPKMNDWKWWHICAM